MRGCRSINTGQRSPESLPWMPPLAWCVVEVDGCFLFPGDRQSIRHGAQAPVSSKAVCPGQPRSSPTRSITGKAVSTGGRAMVCVASIKKEYSGIPCSTSASDSPVLRSRKPARPSVRKEQPLGVRTIHLWSGCVQAGPDKGLRAPDRKTWPTGQPGRIPA